MSPDPVDLTDMSRGRGAALTRPRPGHADLTGVLKYDRDDARADVDARDHHGETPLLLGTLQTKPTNE